MKTEKYQKRFYRDWVGTKDLFKIQITVKETDILFSLDKKIKKEILEKLIIKYRNQIEDYISKDRRFLITLKPLEIDFKAAAIIKDMARAAKQANVGPMAAVAGAIAQYVGEELLKLKICKQIIVENGGDIFLKINKPVQIAICAGNSSLSGKLFLKIKPKNTPIGICTSSGTVGHSLNFGKTDATIIVAKSATLADAVATSVANQVNCADDAKKAINFAKNISGVQGVLIIMGKFFSTWGKIELSA